MEREEAIKRIKAWNLDSDDMAVLSVVIPELRESEDERVWKWIYTCIESLGYPADKDAEKELEEMQPLALAWLEEQKPIEEKAKAYDEALERARLLNADNMLSDEAIKEIFPQLADSEDKEEKIRENCIHFLELQKTHHASTIEIDECIAWLEKQKEQNPVLKFSVGDYVIDTNYKGGPLYQIVGIDKECYICEYRGDKEMGDRAVMHFAFDNPYLRLEQKPKDVKS